MPSSRAKKSKNAKSDAIKVRIEREYRKLALALDDRVGFRLFIANYNDLRCRDELIERVINESRTTRIIKIDLSDADPQGSFVGQLVENCTGTDAEALMVIGLEAMLNYSPNAEQGLAFFETANLQRELLPEQLPLNVVLWLSPLGNSDLADAAQDLWHWRSATFDFTTLDSNHSDISLSMTSINSEDRDRWKPPSLERHIKTIEEILDQKSIDVNSASIRDLEEYADLLIDLGQTYAKISRSSEAVRAFEAANELILSNMPHSIRKRTRVLRAIGENLRVQGKTDEATEVTNQALSLAREANDEKEIASALTALAYILSSQGKFQKSVKFLEKARKLILNDDPSKTHSAIYRHLGMLYSRDNRFNDAIKNLNQALEIHRRLGDSVGEGYAIFQLGAAHRRNGNLKKAWTCFENAHDLAKMHGARRLENFALSGLGRTSMDSGELERALLYFNEEHDIAKEINDRDGQGIALSNLGIAHAKLGETHKAIEFFKGSLEIARETGDRHGESSALYHGALALDQFGDRVTAILWLKEVLAIREAIEDPIADQSRRKLAEWTGQSEAEHTNE